MVPDGFAAGLVVGLVAAGFGSATVPRRRSSGGCRRSLAHALLERRDSLLLVGPELAKPGFERLQPVAILFRLAEQVGHLALERIEPLIERRHRGLRRRGIVGEAGGVRGAALGEDLALHLLHLPLEPIDALLGRRRPWRWAKDADGMSAMAA